MEVMQKHQSMKSHGNNRCSSREIDLHVVKKSPEMSHFQKTRQKLTIFGIFNELLSTQNVNVARFARTVKCDFLADFQPL